MMERLERKQRELTRLAEVEEEDQIPFKAQYNRGSAPRFNPGPDRISQIEERRCAEREDRGRPPISRRAQNQSDGQGRPSTPAEEEIREERGGHRGRASGGWIQHGGGPQNQEPSTRRGSSGGQQGLGEEGGDIGEETPCTEQHQAIFLRTKLRHILRTLRIKDHETEGPLKKKPTPARGARSYGSDAIQDRRSAGRERSVFQGREHEPRAPGASRITPLYGL